eukprot:170375-Pelagomonas_calceolata.AAC.3
MFPTHSTACRYVDNSQNAADIARTNRLLSMVHKRVVPVIEELEPVLGAFDASKNPVWCTGWKACDCKRTNQAVHCALQDGFLSKHDLLAGCATLGVVLNDQELNTLMPLLRHNEEGYIDYHSFVEVFANRVDENTGSPVASTK